METKWELHSKGLNGSGHQKDNSDEALMLLHLMFLTNLLYQLKT